MNWLCFLLGPQRPLPTQRGNAKGLGWFKARKLFHQTMGHFLRAMVTCKGNQQNQSGFLCCDGVQGQGRFLTPLYRWGNQTWREVTCAGSHGWWGAGQGPGSCPPTCTTPNHMGKPNQTALLSPHPSLTLHGRCPLPPSLPPASCSPPKPLHLVGLGSWTRLMSLWPGVGSQRGPHRFPHPALKPLSTVQREHSPQWECEAGGGGVGGLVSEWLVCFSTCLLVFFLFHKLFSVNTWENPDKRVR